MAEAITLLHVFSTFAVGGPQRRFATLAKALPGYRHVIVAMDNRYDAAALLDGVNFELGMVEIRKGAAIDIGNLHRLRKMIRKVAPDVLCTYNWGSMEAVIANRIALRRTLAHHIHFEDGFGPEESPERQLPRRVKMRRMFLKDTHVILPSATLFRVALEQWKLVRSEVIPNGVDTELFTPAEKHAQGPLVIGTVGALRPEKNFARLIEAFAGAGLAAQARLVIAGDGPERDALTGLAARLNISAAVDFAGHVSEPAAFYRTFDIFAMSSDTEQMPLSLLEAMATGLPVAATDVGDIRAIVAEENRGEIVPLDAEALGQALSRLATDAGRRVMLGKANRARVEAEYGLSRMIEDYDGLFKETAAGR